MMVQDKEKAKENLQKKLGQVASSIIKIAKEKKENEKGEKSK